MRLQINKGEFIKYWQTAERAASVKSTINTLTGIKIKASESSGQPSILLEATDLKTSIKYLSKGILVEEEGEAIVPVKTVGELFKKIPTSIFTVSIQDGKGLIIAGRNRYQFTTYPVREFPTLPVSESAAFFCTITASELLRALNEGMVASTLGEEFPKYLGTAYFLLNDGELKIISTDGRRLSLSKAFPEEKGEDSSFLLPTVGMRELQRLLTSLDGQTQIRILTESTLAFFQMGDLEFSARRVDATFPDYTAIIDQDYSATLSVDREDLIQSLERVEIITRTFNRTVILRLSPKGDLILAGKSPEAGTVQEVLNCEIDGEPVIMAFDVGYLLDGLKAFSGEKAFLRFNKSTGRMTMVRPEEKNFLYVVMQIKLSEGELAVDEEVRDENSGEVFVSE